MTGFDDLAGVQVRTGDLDEAREHITLAYAPHRIAAPRTGDFSFAMKLARVERVNIGLMGFRSDVAVAAPPLASYYVVCFAPSGSVEVSRGRESLCLTGGTAAVMTPDEPLRWERWSRDASLVAVRVDRGDLEDDLGAVLGRPVVGPVRFRFAMRLGSGDGSPFLRVLRLLRQELARGDGLAQFPVVEGTLGQLVRSSLVVSQPHEYSDEVVDPRGRGLPSSIRAALDAVDADPTHVRTAADLARTACVSLRTLEHHCGQKLGMSPMTYVREVRLARARADLLRSDPMTETVTGIARRWGFANMSRFAAFYQRKYGELPSQTLRES